MKTLIFPLILSILLFSCGDDESTVVEVDINQPVGTFTSTKSGAFVEQNSTGTTGSAQLGTDSEGTQFIRFSEDYNTNFNTGTLTVFLSTTNENLDDVFDPSTGNMEVRLVGVTLEPGETFYRLDPVADAKFTYIILWCASAGIPFGFAELN